jgi:putative transposase
LIDAVALDPGVRTFQTFYSEVLHGKMGEGDFQRIYRLCLHLDRLMPKISKAKCRQKPRLKHADERMRWKIYDFVDELHKKTANFLVRTFDRIFIPTFETSQWEEIILN